MAEVRRHHDRRTVRAVMVLSALFFMSLVCLSVVQGVPITRDDFICCDTSADSLGAAIWPSVTLDGSGRITLVNLRQQITETRSTLRLFLTGFDPQGNLLQPSLQVLPDTVAADTIVWATGLTPLSAANAGQLLFPVHATVTDLQSHELGRGIVMYVDNPATSDAPTSIPLVFVPGEGNHYRPYMAVGDINNKGVCGVAWIGSQAEPPYGAKLFVRLYDPAKGSLGHFIVPSSLPTPPEVSGMTIERRLKGPPALAVADDGSFAVAWIGEGKADARLLYAVYDGSGRPRGPVRFADGPDGGVVRSINMAGTSEGEFFLVWSADRAGRARHYCRTHLCMRGFDANGSPLFPEVRVDDADSTNIIDEQIVYPSIACDDYGNLLIAWADGRLHPDSRRADLKQDVFVQRFLPDGTRVGSNSRVNDTPGNAGLKGTHSDCALNNEGQAIIVWREFGKANTIKAQLQPLESIGQDLPGDLNCDLKADEADLIALRDYLLGREPNFIWPRSRADVDGDSRVDISDLVYLSDFLADRP